jgi:hypothetical protein
MWILLAMFVALLFAVLLQRHQQSKVMVAGPAETVKIDSDKVTRIKIHNKDGDTELERTGSEWKLVKPVEFPANADLVQGLLKALQELKLDDVISSNPANRGTYQVDSTGTAVEVWTGDKQALSIVVGKSTSDWTHTFVRRTDKDEVYRADGVITYQFNRKPDDWRDKTILKLEDKDIRRIVLEYPKERKQLAVVRADSTHWQVQVGGAPPQSGDSLTVARVVTGAAHLTAVGFPTPEEQMGRDFGSADFRLAVDTGGTTKFVNFVGVDDNKMLARVEGNPTVFTVYKSNLGMIMKDENELLTGKKKEDTAAKPGKATKKKT